MPHFPQRGPYTSIKIMSADDLLTAYFIKYVSAVSHNNSTDDSVVCIKMRKAIWTSTLDYILTNLTVYA